MYTSADEVRALQRVADLEAPLAAVESGLTGLRDALASHDARTIESQAALLHAALAHAVGVFTHAARAGGVPPPLRQRLALAGAQVAAQREALARATAALDRAIDVLLPGVAPQTGVYGANGAAARNAYSGQLQA
jgi:hypothetical protein